jgi:chromosomal replication initiation ATPase DnaA
VSAYQPMTAFTGAIVNRLVSRACEVTGVPLRDVMTARYSEACYVRFAVMKVAREQGKSLPQIGRAMGKDHTTVLHATRKADELAVSHPDFRELLFALRNEWARML